MSVFQELFSARAPGGSCTKVVCTRPFPEKLITFHRAVMRTAMPHDYRVIALADADIEDIFAQLSITFLGQTSIYAIKDGDISVSDRKEFDSFLRDYTGPHHVYFFTSDPAYGKNALLVETAVTKSLFQELAVLVNNVPVSSTFIGKLFALKVSYTFDESLTLLDYANLLGTRSNEAFFAEWVQRILVDDVSLFTLSQYFFSQQKSLLIQEWSRLKERYPAEFWITFFSEQLWQATLYNRYAAKGKAAEAKRWTYRLPFSYVQRDWKKNSIERLVAAHEFLYHIDYGLKNGYATTGLELFIHTVGTLKTGGCL